MPSSTPGPAPDQTNQTILQGDRIELSFGTDEDARILFPYVHGDGGRVVTDWLLWDGPTRVEDMASYFRHHTTGTFVPSGFHWLVRDRDGLITSNRKHPMGALGINQKGPLGRCSIGYWLAEPYWGKGIMAEALSLVLDPGYETLGVVKFEAEVFIDNARSIALLESLGFSREGTIRHAQFKRGRWVDEHLYGATRSDFVSARS